MGKAKEGLVEKVRGERNSMELERGFHGVKRVVVLDEDAGNQFSIMGGLEGGKRGFG